MVRYASVNPSSAHPPPSPGNPGAFAHVVSPRGGALAMFSWPGGGAFAYPHVTPRHLTRMWFPWKFILKHGRISRQRRVFSLIKLD